MNGETHEKRRRLWLRGMNHQSLDEYEGIIVKRTNQLLGRLEQESREGKTVDIVQWINYWAFDFMGDLMYANVPGYDLYLLLTHDCI